MVDPSPNHSNKDLMHVFIHYDDKGDHTSDRHHATEIVSLLKQRDLQVDGCLTVPLAVMVPDILWTRGRGSAIVMLLWGLKFSSTARGKRIYLHLI
ncbi:hypothetical protein DPMN_176126 [Dreissena polymorpha]|uniref:Uncharacterized protein n=1 Tax=Dreissena polymorpha TaxID=45954 RepID=A0A9D4EAD1_DREPO|nr:hypothetical protein DPMN_176126 [Dreissena polymorpha]